jgi:hypothetical protein
MFVCCLVIIAIHLAVVAVVFAGDDGAVVPARLARLSRMRHRRGRHRSGSGRGAVNHPAQGAKPR